MLTREGCTERQKRLWNGIPAEIAWAVISEPQHLVYFANYWSSPFVFNSQNAAALLLLGRDGTSILVADNVHHAAASAAFATETVAPVWYRSVESAPERKALLVSAAVEALRGRPGPFACEASTCPAGLVAQLSAGRPAAAWHDVEPAIRALRRCKDPDEIGLLRKSLRAIDAGQRAGRRETHAGMTELDVFWLVQEAAHRALGEQVIVYGDFVSGPRCLSGGPPTARVIEAGDLVQLDFSVVCRGYRGDTANAFVCDGEPTVAQRDLYELCLAAMRAGEGALRAGTAASEVYRAVHGVLDAQNLAQHFPHHAGHGVGLGHPEPPYFVPQSTDTLVVGDVVTLEPGLYVPGIGGMRFERNYLIQKSGFEVLSQHALTLDQAV